MRRSATRKGLLLRGRYECLSQDAPTPTGGWAWKARCRMGKLARAVLVAVLLAVGMLSSAASASADTKPGLAGTKHGLTVRHDLADKHDLAKLAGSDVLRAASITWE